MQMVPDEVRRRMAAMSDEDLRRVVTVEAEQYQPEAIAIAREELARRQPPEPPPLPPPLGEPERFRLAAALYHPARGLTGALQALVLLQLVSAVLVLAGFITQWCSIAAHAFPGPLSEAADIAIEQGDHVRMLGWLAALVVFCVWVHRMYRNLPALGSVQRRFTPGGAVGAYFIPFVNLVRGYQVIHHLWIESQPLPEPAPEGMVFRRSAPLVGWWWGFHIAANLLGRTFGNTPARSLDDWLLSSYSSAAFLVTILAGGSLFLAVVRGIARRQRDQWEAIVRRRPGPPAPDRIL
jgi:hypothetical protein